MPLKATMLGGGRRDLNPQYPESQSGALTIRLRPPKWASTYAARLACPSSARPSHSPNTTRLSLLRSGADLFSVPGILHAKFRLPSRGEHDPTRYDLIGRD